MISMFFPLCSLCSVQGQRGLSGEPCNLSVTVMFSTSICNTFFSICSLCSVQGQRGLSAEPGNLSFTVMFSTSIMFFSICSLCSILYVLYVLFYISSMFGSRPERITWRTWPLECYCNVPERQ